MSEILLYGVVGGEIDAAQSVATIRALGKKSAKIRLNTPGGIVWDGNAIAEAVHEHGGIDTHIDALAASMGSVIFLRGKTRTMAPRSRLMIHNPASFVFGDAKTLRKEADALDSIGIDFAQFYADATDGKISREEALQMMDEETWFTAEQAVALGFAHSVTGSATACAHIPATMQFRNIPKGLATMSTETQEAKPSLLQSILARVGVGAKTNEIDSARAELATTQAELFEAQGAIVDAVAKITEAEARASEAVAALATAKAEHAAEVEGLKAAHIAALEAAKIEGEQSATAQMLKDNGPEPLPHQEEVEGAPSTHTAKWNALRAAGKHAEAGEYYSKHKSAIFQGA